MEKTYARVKTVESPSAQSHCNGSKKTEATWGPYYEGRAALPLSSQEERVRTCSNAYHGRHAYRDTRENLLKLTPDAPLFCRVTFIETVAAVCSKFPDEVNRKVTGTAKELRKVLWSACAPDRLEFLFNNLRMRHAIDPSARALLPTGTTSNEALHSEINSWTRQIQGMRRSTLQLKLLSRNIALCHPPVRQMRDNTILARASCTSLWSQKSWSRFCSSFGKAPVPLHRQRQAESIAIKNHSKSNVKNV